MCAAIRANPARTPTRSSAASAANRRRRSKLPDRAMTQSPAFQVEPLSTASFGAVVTGLRLASIDAGDFADLYRTWLEYALLIFPDQHLTRGEQIAFARRFGPLEFEFAPISNVRADGSVRADDNADGVRSEEHTSELQSRLHLVC